MFQCSIFSNELLLLLFLNSNFLLIHSTITNENDQVKSNEKLIKSLISKRDSYAKAASEFSRTTVPSTQQSPYEWTHREPERFVNADGSSYAHAGAGETSAFHYTIYPHTSFENPHQYYSNYYNYDLTQQGTSNDISIPEQMYQHNYSIPQESATIAEIEEPVKESSWMCWMFPRLCNIDDYTNRQGGPTGNSTLGILGLVAVGLKSLKLVKFGPLLIPFLPILLPILLILAIPVVIAAWFLPVVPVIVLGRSLSVSAFRNIRETLENEQCMDRLACEIGKLSRSIQFEAPWAKRLEEVSKNIKWIIKIREGRNTNGVCSKYLCRPISKLQKSLLSLSTSKIKAS